MRLILALLVLVGLASCSEEQAPVGPKKKTRIEIPSTAPDEPQEQAPSWIPRDSDIVGSWKKACTVSPTDATKAIQQTITFSDDRLLIETETYSDPACATRAEVVKQDLVWEEGWDDSLPQLDGVFLKGWRSLFIDESDRDNRVLYETAAVLALENGKRVLYIRWTTEKSVLLEKTLDRFEIVPE